MKRIEYTSRPSAVGLIIHIRYQVALKIRKIIINKQWEINQLNFKSLIIEI